MQNERYKEFLKNSRDKVAGWIIEAKDKAQVQALFAADMNGREDDLKIFKEAGEANIQFAKSERKRYVEWTEKTPAGRLHMRKLRKEKKDRKDYAEYLKQLTEWEQKKELYEQYKEYIHPGERPKEPKSSEPPESSVRKEYRNQLSEWLQANELYELRKIYKHPGPKPKKKEQPKLPIADFEWGKRDIDCVDPLVKFEIPMGPEHMTIYDYRVLLGVLHDGVVKDRRDLPLADLICPELWGSDTFEYALYKMVKENSEYQALINKAILSVEKNLRKKGMLGNEGSEKQPKRNMGQIANDVFDLVRKPKKKNMTTFRDRCKCFYGKLKESIDKYPKEIIANNEKPGKKLSVKLRKKLREKFKGEPNLFEYLFFPRSLYDPKLAHVVAVFGMADEEDGCVPYDEELSLLADYVRLTILHDRQLTKPRTKLINNGIWVETEQWAEELWEEMIKGWNSPDVIDDFYYSYIRVKDDLESIPNLPAVPKANRKNNATGNILGMSWQTAKEKGEAHVKEHGFPGVSPLAKVVGCSRGLMYKAIGKSKLLLRAHKQSKKKTSPPTEGLNEGVTSSDESIAPSPDDEADVILLCKEKSKQNLVDGIVMYTCIIDKDESKKDPNHKPVSEQKLRLDLEKLPKETLARFYISRQVSAHDIHADDPGKPGHRRRA